jgi:hypothetical protein
VFFTGNEIDDFDLRRQSLVGQGHSELKFEIGEYPKSTNDHLGLDLASEVDGQPTVAADLDTLMIAQRSLDHSHPFIHGKNNRF